MAIFECSFRSSSVAAAGTYNVIFTTGAAPCVFLSRNVSFLGTAYIADVYEAPTGVAGGVAISLLPLDNIVAPVATGAMLAGSTITTQGTKRGATTWYRNGQSTVGTFGSSARTRRLKANTTYLLQVTNQDAGAQVFDLYFAWYEGPDTAPLGAATAL